MMRVMAREWAPHGVTVNAVGPGYVETDLTRDYLDRDGHREELESLVPARRLGRPEEVADAVTFLASDRAGVHHRPVPLRRRRPHARLTRSLTTTKDNAVPLAPVPMPRRFEGRSVVVTGAGTGFGAEIAVRAAQEGARVVGVHYRSSKAGAEATAERVRGGRRRGGAAPGRHRRVGAGRRAWPTQAFDAARRGRRR